MKKASVIKIKSDLQRKKAPRPFLFLSFFSFLLLYFSLPLPAEASDQDNRNDQQLINKINQAAASGGINNLAELKRRYDQFKRQTEKQYGSMDKAAEEWEKTQTVIEYHDIFARVRWLRYRAQVKLPQNLQVFHFNFSGTREFRGRFWKTYPTGDQNPPDYGFDWLNQAGPLKGVSASADSSGGGSCQGSQWIFTENSQLKPHGSYLSPIGIYVTLNAGIQIPYGDCIYPPPFITKKREQMNGWGMTEDYPLEFTITKQDVDTFVENGHWSKDFSGVVLSDNPASVPPGKLFVLAPPRMRETMQIDAAVRVEFFLSPDITGPHYLANPIQATEPFKNRIVLEVPPFPEWVVSPIQPVDGWKEDQPAKKETETPPPGPTVTLLPVKAGSLDFHIKRTDPKGKKSDSKPFDVNVVELEFNRAAPCDAYDKDRFFKRSDGSLIGSKDGTAGAIAVTVGQENKVWLNSKTPFPGKTKFEPMDDTFRVIPKEVEAFPALLVIKGIKKGHSKLTAIIENMPGRFQKAAELWVDVLPPRQITALPVVREGLYTQQQIEEFFNAANEVLKQSGVTVRPLPAQFFDPAKLPSVPVAWQSNNLPLAEYDALINYANNAYGVPLEDPRKGQKRGAQNITVFFLDGVYREKFVKGKSPDGYPNESPGLKPMSGTSLEFYCFIPAHEYKRTMVITLAHEIGHYLFALLYADNRHSTDEKMLMYVDDKCLDCDIRQPEWRAAEERIR